MEKSICSSPVKVAGTGRKGCSVMDRRGVSISNNVWKSTLASGLGSVRITDKIEMMCSSKLGSSFRDRAEDRKQ